MGYLSEQHETGTHRLPTQHTLARFWSHQLRSNQHIQFWMAAAVLLALGQPVLAQDWQQVEAQDLRLARVIDGLG